MEIEILFTLAILFLIGTFWLDANKEKIRFRLGFEENRREQSKGLITGGLLGPPSPGVVWGVDTSGWDGVVNFFVTKSLGAAFAIIKAMEGTVKTRFFLENTKGAIAAGLIVGAYHWLHQNARVPARLQAAEVWALLKNLPLHLPLLVDFESTKWNGLQADPNYADLELFADAWIALSGKKPAVYSSPAYLRRWGPMPRRLREKLAYIHIAHYGVVTPDYADWLFHQYSDVGDAEMITPNDGGKKEVDLNKFAGSLSALYLLAGLTTSPIPNPPEEVPDMDITFTGQVKETAQASSNVRVSTSTTSGLVGTLAPGMDFTAVGGLIPSGGYNWLHIVTPLDGYLAITANIEYEPVPVDVPDLTLTIESVYTEIIVRRSDGKRFKGAVSTPGIELVEIP